MTVISSNLLAALAVTVVVIAVSDVLYNVFLHPLSRFPGPLLGRATSFYRHYLFMRGELQYALKRLHDAHGPVVRIAPNELSYVDAQAWKDIYLPLGDRNGPGEMVLYDRFYRFAGPNSPDTLVTLNMEDHARLRHELVPAFSERTLRLQEPIMQGYVDLLVRRLGEESRGGEQPLNLRDWFNFYSFDIIGNLGFGSDFSGLEHSKLHPWVRAVTQNVREFAFLQMLMYMGLQRLVHMLANSSLLKGRVLHENLTRQKLLARMAAGTERPDLLEPLLRLKEAMPLEQIFANGSLLIIAGSESSATLLVATVSFLAENPAAMRRLTDEIRTSFRNEDEITLTTVNNLRYLFACVSESLRRFPPVPTGLPRVTPPGGAVICGQQVPQNTIVSVAQWASYHSEANFTDPFGYHPERFMKDPRFANDCLDVFQPFGYGHRSCPGRTLGLSETRLALARILYNFDIEPLPASRDWARRQKTYLLWYKQDYWARVKAVR
ncbi:hypothetical protein CDD83_7335 [Cordyceps sp. RAO-2017]|nr:hypothetical protein CDD83_7335 [Cordyceps sp. RAO-2017]